MPAAATRCRVLGRRLCRHLQQRPPGPCPCPTASLPQRPLTTAPAAALATAAAAVSRGQHRLPRGLGAGAGRKHPRRGLRPRARPPTHRTATALRAARSAARRGATPRCSASPPLPDGLARTRHPTTPGPPALPACRPRRGQRGILQSMGGPGPHARRRTLLEARTGLVGRILASGAQRRRLRRRRSEHRCAARARGGSRPAPLWPLLPRPQLLPPGCTPRRRAQRRRTRPIISSTPPPAGARLVPQGAAAPTAAYPVVRQAQGTAAPGTARTNEGGAASSTRSGAAAALAAAAAAALGRGGAVRAASAASSTRPRATAGMARTRAGQTPEARRGTAGAAATAAAWAGRRTPRARLGRRYTAGRMEGTGRATALPGSTMRSTARTA
jgi:hypothetical protein